MKHQFEVVERQTCYQGFFRMDKVTVQHERFNGGSIKIERELLERGDAAAVLLYDPLLDQLVMVEQFRVGALGSADTPWLVEIVAGIVESNETPDSVVSRESFEETGLRIDEIEFISEFFVSPGGCSERMYLFCGSVDAGRAGGVFGLEHEGEDIRSFVIGAAEVPELLVGRKMLSATTIVALQWFLLNRARLREKWNP